MRLGIPALFHFFRKQGYDVWVYSANYYSMEYIRRLFRHYNIRVTGIVTGTGRKAAADPEKRAQLEKQFKELYTVTCTRIKAPWCGWITQPKPSANIPCTRARSGPRRSWILSGRLLTMKKRTPLDNMRVSFDLDEVLFVSPKTHLTEPPLPFPLNKFHPERLRLGTPELIHALQSMECEVWVHTSSFRSERYIKTLFRLYGVRFDGIVNGDRHLREVQRDSRTILPQKLPNHYRISLHVDDESAICSLGREYGFEAYQLDAQDDDWKEKIIARAAEVKRLIAREHGLELE